MSKNLKIKVARAEKDWTQDDLAKAIGVTRQTIGLIEAGKYNPTIKLCLSIAKALGKTLDDLFWEVKDEN
ncbi:MAG: helix-turn-helix transcriptional regulator [Clostridia bacterium]|nr:helix-turn-helix transcriptional regulator [Clostridia bacterium]